VKLSMPWRLRAAIVASGGQIAIVYLSMKYQLSAMMSKICKICVEGCSSCMPLVAGYCLSSVVEGGVCTFSAEGTNSGACLSLTLILFDPTGHVLRVESPVESV
jgi:hypothetical protein